MNLFLHQLHSGYKVLEGNRTNEGNMAKRLLRNSMTSVKTAYISCREDWTVCVRDKFRLKGSQQSTRSRQGKVSSVKVVDVVPAL
jgi:hypothetical protein